MAKRRGSRVRNARQVKADMDRWADDVQVQYAKLFKRTCFEVFTGIIEKNPVDTGHSRSAWAVGIGGEGHVEPIPKTKKENHAVAVAMAAANNRTQEAKFALIRPRSLVKVLITNNVPYIFDLENGSSGQAPQGMVSVTIQEVRMGLAGGPRIGIQKI